MTAPDDPTRDQPTVQQPAVEPSVATAPPPAQRHRWWSAIPHHLGRARTSTVVLVLLFLSVGVLHLYVKPDAETPPTTPTGNTGVTEPAPTTVGPTTAPPEETTAPVPTTEVEPTTTEETPSATEPEETTVPEQTTETVPPATTEPTSVPPLPPTSEPTG